MRSAAQLCAREEQHECAARLLMLAVERQPVDAGVHEHIESVKRRTNRRFSEEGTRALHALALLLGETALCRDQPWPLTTVQLTHIAGDDNFARLLATSYGVPTSCVMQVTHSGPLSPLSPSHGLFRDWRRASLASQPHRSPRNPSGRLHEPCGAHSISTVEDSGGQCAHCVCSGA